MPHPKHARWHDTLTAELLGLLLLMLSVVGIAIAAGGVL
jgi:hypothetical protein